MGFLKLIDRNRVFFYSWGGWGGWGYPRYGYGFRPWGFY